MSLDIRRVGVVGLGTMGAGIVEVFARSGVSVVAADAAPEWVDRGRGFLEASTARAEARGRLVDRTALLDLVSWTTDIADLAGVDLVLEAVPEILELKRSLLASVDAVLGSDGVIATNTSSLPVTLLAESTGRPSRVVGMHFFNPAPVLRLVEIITTVHSDEAVVSSVRDLAVRLGKTPIVVGDRPGFVANALLFGYLGDAVRLLERGDVSRERLDAALVASGMPLGPLALLDLIGLDVSAHVLEVLHASSGDPRHAVPLTLAGLVADGHLGRKTGQGFWTYERPGSGTVIDAAPTSPSADDAAIVDALVLPYVHDAARMVDEGYASAEDVDTAMREGCGFPHGPIEEARARRL
jgi:3-hydroxybutyryl-CoA dehydrogenase